MIKIEVCPSTLKAGYSSYSPEAMRTLFDGKPASHIFSDPFPSSESESGHQTVRKVGRISLSGAQPKYSVVLNKDGKLRYTRENEPGAYILKPRPNGSHIMNREYCAANENLTMQLARQVYGIKTAPNGICFFEDNESMAYITKRFDFTNETKLPQEEFAALMGFSKDFNGSEYKYALGSYEECGEIIKKYVRAYLPDLRRFFGLILFNFLTLNDDAHLKNFSLIEYEGEYRLSPAYDLINTSLQIWEPRIFALDKGLFREGMKLTDTRWITKKDFEEFGKRLGLPDRVIKQDIEKFLEKYSLADTLINNSFLSEELKQKYRDGYNFRRNMLTF